MTKQSHKVWEVRVGSRNDEQLRDRFMTPSGHRWLKIHKLPVRKLYIIEAKGQGNRAEAKALNLAAADDIPNAVIMSVDCLQPGKPRVG